MRSLIAILILFTSISHAQSKGFFSVQATGGSALRLSDLDLDVNLDGAFAETTLDVAYANDSDQALQGLFKIQLPAGAVVRDFALRLGDKWQFGSLTEKQKARQTFEEIVRRGADPAVLAWDNGVEYQVRIFPFPRRGKRYIRIRYWQELPGNAGQFAYGLPLPAGVKLDSFHMKLNAHASSLADVKVGEAYSKMIYFKSEESGFGAIVDEKNFTVPGEFKVTAAQTKSPVWIGQTTPHGDMTYVGARFFAELPQHDRKLAHRLLVFFDTSRSAKPDHPQSVAEILKTLTSKYSQVTNYEFDATVRKVAALYPEHASYDGGTDFAKVLAEIEHQAESGAVDVLVLSDAMPTMQREADFESRNIAGAKIFVLPVKSRFNPHFASLLADKSGGSVLPLGNKDQVMRTFTHSEWRVEGLHYDDGTAVDIYPEAGTPVGESLSMFFRSKTGHIPHSVILTVSDGTDKRELKADLANPPNVPEVENLWAMAKLMNLVPHADEYSADLAAHAERYKLVSPMTSYIVLENEWDYQRFNITNREENQTTGLLGAFSEGKGFGVARGAVMKKARAAAAPAVTGGRAVEFEVANDAAPVMAQTAAADKMVPVREQERFVPRAPNPPPGDYVESTSHTIEDSIPVSEARKHYATGFFAFGRLDKIYNEKNTPEMNDAWFFVELAQAYAAKGEKQKAIRVISNLFEISEEDGRALRTMGLVGCIAGNCDLAIAAFKMAMVLRPEEPQNPRDLAWLYAQLGRLKEAAELMNSLRGKTFHARFPGMEVLIAREADWFAALAKGENRSPAGQDGKIYSYITWNNDNSDIDFHIREHKQKIVWYGNRQGQGELSNDFTRGYGPEVYLSHVSLTPEYFVHYFNKDHTSENDAVVVKFATIERTSGGKVQVHSEVFPLYTEHQYVKMD